MQLELCPFVEGEGKQWRFIGIWAKNRWEWTNTLLAAMHFSVTAVGFYDAMAVEQVDYIVRQTELSSIVCTPDYAGKLIGMKKGGMVPSLNSLIVIGVVDPALLQAAQAQSLYVHTYSHVLSQGNLAAPMQFSEPTKHDVYIFSYTSGTTGDPKGVKLTHNNVLTAARNSLTRITMNAGETMISYLPYTHSFE